MKVLFVSKEGQLLPLAERVEDEGHTVTLHIHDKKYVERGRGTVKTRSATFVGPLIEGQNAISGSITNLIDRVAPDIVVCDKGMGKVGEIVKRMGIKTWGSDRWSELVHGDYERKMLRAMGVSEFKEPEPSDASFGVGAFSDGDILYNPFLCVRERGMQNRGVGVQIDSSVCVQALHAGHPLLKELQKIEEVIKKVSYKGMLVLSNKLEVGFSLPLFACLYELTKGRVLSVLKGDKAEVTKQWAAATRITLPPFPAPASHKFTKHMEIGPKAKRHIWLVDSSNSQVGICNGDVGWVSARGTDEPQPVKEGEEPWLVNPLRECRRRILRTISNIKSQNEVLAEIQYRTDLGVRAAMILAEYEAKDKTEWEE